MTIARSANLYTIFIANLNFVYPKNAQFCWQFCLQFKLATRKMLENARKCWKTLGIIGKITTSTMLHES